MLRQLLTLLAVISGFTLAATPVSAADARAVSIAALQEKEDCKPVVQGPLQILGQDQLPPQEELKPCKKPVIVYVPPVMLQADRARE